MTLLKKSKWEYRVVDVPPGTYVENIILALDREDESWELFEEVPGHCIFCRPRRRKPAAKPSNPARFWRPCANG